MRLPSALIEPLEQRIAPASLSIGDASVMEGDTGTTTATFTVSLSAAPGAGETVTVSYTAAVLGSDTATGGTDFQTASSSLSFAEGETEKTISISVVGDALDEADETFTVTLSGPSAGNDLADATGTGTITDDDATPEVSVGDVSIVEGDNGTKTAVFTLGLNAPSGRAVTVQATTANGTAVAGVDYVAFDGAIQFLAGQTSRTVSVTLNGDFEDEADETFFLNLTAPQDVTIADGQGVATITNDDLRLLIADATTTEGNSGTKLLTFTVTLSATATHPVSVLAKTAPNTASSDGTTPDFVALEQTLNFAVGERTKTFSVTINGDTTPEAAEFFTVGLSAATGAVVAVPTARGTITNDDAVLRISDARVLEGNGGTSAQAVFTVTLENGPTGAVTVDYTTADGTATTADDDYQAVATAVTLTFQPGETTKTFSIPVTGETDNEGDETFVVNLANVTGIAAESLLDGQGTATIVNDDGPLLTIGDATLVEGDSGSASMVFVVSLLGTNNSQVTVDFTTADGTATESDYTTATGQLTFTSGITQRTIAVPILGDRVREAAESFFVRLTDVSGGSLADSEAVGTITDNDPQPAFSISGGSVVEGNSGTRNAVFVVTLDGGADAPVTVNFATQSGGTAATGTDFTATTTTLTFAPGQTVQSVNVPVLGDTEIEPDETISGALSGASGATIATGTASATILNDDILVTIANNSGGEGNSGNTAGVLTVTLSAVATAPVTVNFTVAAGTAVLGTDFAQNGTATSVVIAAGQTSTTIPFNLIGDTVDEANETFSVTLTGATNAALGAQTTGTFTITDDDNAPSISIANASATETDGASTMNFTVTLSAASQQTITVKASTADGTAVKVNDYLEQTGVLITFAPGETSKTFPVSIVGNNVDEASETFTVTLTEPSSGATLGTAQATGTITDDDQPTLSVANVNTAEGNTGTKTLTFTVALAAQATQQVTVNFTTANGSATAGSDYTAASGVLTFAPGETSKTVDVIITGDTANEADEIFFLRLTNAAGATIADSEAEGRIQNDESTFKLVPVTATATEDGTGGGAVTFKVVREGNTTQTGTVSFTTVDGTASAGSDYTARSGTLVFTAGQTEKTITVNLAADLAFENTEAFLLRLTNSVGGVFIDGDGDVQATLEETATITDNDVRPTLSISNVSANEGTSTSGTTTFTFNVTLSAANQREVVTVDFATADGTAISTAAGALAADFTAKTGTLTFAKGVTSQTITVSVAQDDKDEADAETFTVTLDEAEADGTTPVTITSAIGTGTINDDDAAPTISFDGGTGGDLSITEGNSGGTAATLTVKLSKASERAVTVTLNTVADTATLNDDFQLPAGFPATITFAAGETTKEVVYTILGDVKNEANESFTLTLSNAANATLFDNAAKVTITNDDAAPGLAINNVSQVEGNGAGQQLVFTVTLAGASDRAVTVNFATADGTARSTAPGIDFTAVSGTLTWAAGDATAKTIVVPITGDNLNEVSESFTVVLSNATNATIVQSTGTGTILPDDDTLVGLSIRDAQVVEGNAGTKTVSFTVELSAATAQDVTFSATTRNGTAVRTGDYTALVEDGNTTDDSATDNDFTIGGGETTQTVTITIAGDQFFESTESFFVTLGDVAGATLIDGEARGTIYNDDLQQVDTQTIRYVDEDGDLVTVRINKGTLTTTGSQPVLSFRDVGTVGGKVLEAVDFTSDPLTYNGIDLTITADPQPGFRASGGTSDGRVDIGYIQGAIAQPDLLTFTNGIDFNNITVEGDVGKIVAGDIQTTPAIAGTLSVQSLGVRGTTNLPSGITDNLSAFLSTVNAINVSGDVAGIIQVVGGDFGDINSLRIDGALRGGTQASSGQVFFTGTLVSGVIGEIVGGAGQNSGLISASFNTGAAVDPGDIQTLRVLRGITGGAGANAGKVLAPSAANIIIGTPKAPADLTGGSGSESGTIVIGGRLENVVVHGDIVGGTGASTGEVFAGGSLGTATVGGDIVGGAGTDAGSIVSRGGAASVLVKGNIEGAGGQRSGTVQVSRALGTVTIGVDETLTGGTASAEDGNIRGGRGELSGTVSGLRSVGTAVIHGSIVGGAGNSSGGFQSSGTVTSLDVRGNIEGGSSASPSTEGGATTVVRTGFVTANSLTQMVLGGDLKSGENNGNGLADSGVIRVTDELKSLVIFGDVIGNATARAIISAGGDLNATDSSDATITRLVVRGDAAFLDVLGGYSSTGTVATPRGSAVNPDAQMGAITFLGSVLATNVANGIAAGTDGLFGTVDDGSIGGGSTDAADRFASIARVILRGTLAANSTDFGIAAEQVTSVTVGAVGTAPLGLSAGPGNDFRKVVGPAAAKFYVNEVAV